MAKKELNTEVTFCYVLLSLSVCLVAWLDVTIRTTDSACVVLK